MILLSFDIEEFDVPREHGVDFSLEEGIQVSIEGTNCILDILKKNDVKATFFCTGNFVENAPEVMKRILDEGHEVACHGVDHFNPKESDFRISKEIIENVCGVDPTGYRHPRMVPVEAAKLKKEGYKYDSSLNPTFIPGRYMNLKTPRTWFVNDDVVHIPASVTPTLRIPLFWLAFHNLPKWLYQGLVRHTLSRDGYFVIYFHPWEFYELKEHPEFKMPFIIKNHSGKDMVGRLDNLVKMLKSRNHEFVTYNEFVNLKIKNE